MLLDRRIIGDRSTEIAVGQGTQRAGPPKARNAGARQYACHIPLIVLCHKVACAESVGIFERTPVCPAMVGAAFRTAFDVAIPAINISGVGEADAHHDSSGLRIRERTMVDQHDSALSIAPRATFSCPRAFRATRETFRPVVVPASSGRLMVPQAALTRSDACHGAAVMFRGSRALRRRLDCTGGGVCRRRRRVEHYWRNTGPSEPDSGCPDQIRSGSCGGPMPAGPEVGPRLLFRRALSTAPPGCAVAVAISC